MGLTRPKLFGFCGPRDHQHGPRRQFAGRDGISIGTGGTLDLGGSTQTVASLNDAVTGTSFGNVTNSAAGGFGLLTVTTSGSPTFTGVMADGAGKTPSA